MTTNDDLRHNCTLAEQVLTNERDAARDMLADERRAHAETRARLAEALRRHVCQHGECNPRETHAGCDARATLAAHDAGTPSPDPRDAEIAALAERAQKAEADRDEAHAVMLASNANALRAQHDATDGDERWAREQKRMAAERDAARADAARLAEALHQAIAVLRESHLPDLAAIVEKRAAFTAHDEGTPSPDHRDAEITRLRAALAAGPAALRDGAERSRSEVGSWLNDEPPDEERAARATRRANILSTAADLVESAQRRAMEEG